MHPARNLLAALCIITLPACSLIKKDKAPSTREPHGTISIKVDAHGEKAPILLSAYAPGRAKAILSYKVKDGSITGFILPVGQAYEFRAFADPDNKGEPDPGTPVGILKDVKPEADLSAPVMPLVLEIPDVSGAPRKSRKNDDKKDTPASADKANLINKAAEKLKEVAPSIPIPPLPGKP